MTRSTVDVARILVASLAGFTIGHAFYIGWSYVRTAAHLSAPRRWAPVQIVAFAVAHILYTAHGAVEVVGSLGIPGVTWHTPTLLVANVLSAGVLLVAARKERRRIAAAKAAERKGYPLRRSDDPI